MCEHLNINGSHVIVCGGRHCERYCACGRPCEFLCDWKVRGKKSGTCDRPICARHAKRVAPEKHLCPEHQEAWDNWKLKHPPAQQSLFQEAPQ
jgi:hypothetical protein